jgi:hypothetical protein
MTSPLFTLLLEFFHLKFVRIALLDQLPITNNVLLHAQQEPTHSHLLITELPAELALKNLDSSFPMEDASREQSPPALKPSPPL